MANPNKVEFGISNLHVGTYTVTDGVVALGAPYHQPGAVSFSPEQDAEDNTFYADDIAYWSQFTEGPFSGDLEVALFDDAFKLQFLGHKELTNGGVAQVKNPVKPNVYIAFQVKGDKQNRRVVFYNCALGVIGRSYETVGETTEPATETLGINCTGDDVSGVTKAVLKPGDAGYDTLFTAPTAPEIKTT